MIKSWHKKSSWQQAFNRPTACVRAAALCRANVYDLGMFINLQMEKEDSS